MHQPEQFDDRRRDPGLQVYLEMIGKYDLLTPKAEATLARRVRHGDKAALDQMVNANLRFVVSMAKRFLNRGLTFRDLIAEGNVGLITAAKRFDERREFRFVTYAAWWIRQSIQVALAEQTNTVRLPANRVREANRASELQVKLEQRLQREVTEEDLAEALELHPTRFAQIRAAARPLVSINESPFADGETLAESLPDTDSESPEDELLRAEMRREVRELLGVLSERERDVITRYFGLEPQSRLSLEAIGQAINLSRERVRQIRNRAIDKIRATQDDAELSDLLH